MRKRLTALTVGLAAMLVAAPAQAALDEGAGAVPTPAASPADGFDWADAGIGGGIGAAVVLTLGTGAVIRRHHGETRRAAGPLAQ